MDEGASLRSLDLNPLISTFTIDCWDSCLGPGLTLDAAYSFTILVSSQAYWRSHGWPLPLYGEITKPGGTMLVPAQLSQHYWWWAVAFDTKLRGPK